MSFLILVVSCINTLGTITLLILVVFGIYIYTGDYIVSILIVVVSGIYTRWGLVSLLIQAVLWRPQTSYY